LEALVEEEEAKEENKMQGNHANVIGSPYYLHSAASSVGFKDSFAIIIFVTLILSLLRAFH